MSHALTTIHPEEVTLNAPGAVLPAWAKNLIDRVKTAAAAGQTVTVIADEQMLSPEEVGRRMSMHRSTVVRKIEAGEIRSVKVGSHHKIPYSEFLRYQSQRLDKMVGVVAPDIEAELFGE